jgi:hypothetical protein
MAMYKPGMSLTTTTTTTTTTTAGDENATDHNLFLSSDFMAIRTTVGLIQNFLIGGKHFSYESRSKIFI